MEAVIFGAVVFLGEDEGAVAASCASLGFVPCAAVVEICSKSSTGIIYITEIVLEKIIRSEYRSYHCIARLRGTWRLDQKRRLSILLDICLLHHAPVIDPAQPVKLRFA